MGKMKENRPRYRRSKGESAPSFANYIFKRYRRIDGNHKKSSHLLIRMKSCSL